MIRPTVLSLVLMILVLTGCDTGTPVDRPDATVPTPTWAPVPSVSPAGTVLPVGGPAAALAVSGSRTAVGLPSALAIIDGGRVTSLPVADPVRAVVALPDGGFRAVSGSTVLTVPGVAATAGAAATAPATAGADAGAGAGVASGGSDGAGASAGAGAGAGGGAVVRWSLPGAGTALAVHPSGWTAVAVPSLGDVIILSATGAVARTLHPGGHPAGVAVTGDLVAVLDPAETSLTVYDATSGARREGLRAGDGATTVTTGGPGRFLAVDARDGELLVFETGPLLLRQRFPVPGSPYAAAYDPTRHTLWVAVTARNEVVGYEVTGGSPREVTRHPTPRLPLAVAVDPQTGTVVVAGSAEGLVQRISP